MGEGIEVELPPEHPKLFGYTDSRGWDGTSSRTRSISQISMHCSKRTVGTGSAGSELL